MPRFWLSGPRIGWFRPGISVSGRELSIWGRKSPHIDEAATLGIVRRPDGALLLGIPNLNGANEELPPGAEFLAAFAFGAVPYAVETRTGALVRLGKHVGVDGWVTGQSVGQVIAAIRAEARDLGLQPVFVRVSTGDSEPAQPPTPWWVYLPMGLIIGAVLLAMLAAG